MPKIKYKLMVSPEAKKDLESIRFWSAQNYSPAKTRSYMNLLRAAFSKVVKDPFVLHSKSVDYLRIGLRSFRIERARKNAKASHIIFYSIFKSEAVEIERVLHKAADFGRHIERAAGSSRSNVRSHSDTDPFIET